MSRRPQAEGPLGAPPPSTTSAWLRKRFGSRPDGEHEMVLNRLVINVLVLGYLVAAAALGVSGAREVLLGPGLVFLLYCGASVGFFLHLLRNGGVCIARRILAMVADIAMLSYGLHAGGELTAVLYPIYLWIFFGNGFRFGLRYLLMSTAIGVAGFALVIATTSNWWGHPSLSAGLLVGLVILPLYAATLIRKLENAKRQAEEASRAKSLFLASVSHELRTPLTAIIGMTELLRSGDLDAEQQDMARTAHGAAGSLLALIDDLLDFSRIEAGKMPVRTVPFDLLALLSEVVAMTAVPARAKGLRLSLHVTPRTPHRLVGDRRHLQEILVNLVGNAVKFTERGHVVVAVDGTGDEAKARLRFEVSDTGIGIAPAAREKIFESFSQAHERILDHYGGTGLGLAICRQLVQLLGGAIGVDSVEGRGSTFWFEIALDLDPAASGSEAVPAGLSAVVVTADPEARRLLCRSAATAGARVDAATDISAAAAMLADGPATERRVVLFDGRQPGSDVAAAADILLAAAAPAAGLVLLEPGRAGLPEPALRSRFAAVLDWPPSERHMRSALQAAAAAGGLPSEDRDDELIFRPAERRLKVLVAEDNRTNQRVLRKILERAGHDTCIVGNGEEALDALTRESFDVALMDVNMPVMNGIEATKLYRFASIGRPRMPILGLTADATEEARRNCLEAGMDACATKPIEPARLLRLLAETVPAGASEPRPTAVDGVADLTAHPRFRPGAGAAVEPHVLAELAALGGEEFVAEVAEEFVQDAARVLAALSAAVRAGDGATFRDEAHALRSGAANIGAKAVYDLCLSWRDIGDDELRRQGAEHLRRLQGEFERVRTELDGALPPRRTSRR